MEHKSFYCFYIKENEFQLQCVIIDRSDDKKTIRSRVEDSAVDYWAVQVGGTKNNIEHFYTMIKWF
jgi:hypothetical protein